MAYRRAKGNVGEKAVLKKMRDNGFDVQRVVGSGNVCEDNGDIVWRYLGNEVELEVKFHRQLPIKKLETWKGESDLLVMRENYGEFKVFMDLDMLITLLKQRGLG